MSVGRHGLRGMMGAVVRVRALATDVITFIKFLIVILLLNITFVV